MKDVRSSDRSTPSAPPLAPRILDMRHVIIDDVGPHPSTANGIHHVARRIAREQIHAGDRASIFFLRQAALPGGGDAGDVPTVLLPLDGPRILGHLVGVVPGIVDALTAGAGPDTIFHIHTARQPLLLSLVRQLNRRGFPFAITVHGRYSHVIDRNGSIAHPRSALYLRLIEHHALERAIFVQAVSGAEADVIRRLAPKSRIRVVPNAAYSSALDGIPPAPRRELRLTETPIFGYCGRYEMEHKGLDLLIKGFAIYRSRGGKGRLALIGTGPQRDVLAEMVATLGLSEVADVGGPLFGEEKEKALQGWHYFVQSSRFDGVPIGALEAALAGLPLIVSKETGLSKQITATGAGVVIENLSAEAVAVALETASAVSPADWNAMTRNAFEMASDIGDWTPIAETLRSLYLADPGRERGVKDRQPAVSEKEARGSVHRSVPF